MKRLFKNCFSSLLHTVKLWKYSTKILAVGRKGTAHFTDRRVLNEQKYTRQMLTTETWTDTQKWHCSHLSGAIFRQFPREFEELSGAAAEHLEIAGSPPQSFIITIIIIIAVIIVVSICCLTRLPHHLLNFQNTQTSFQRLLYGKTQMD